MFKELVDEVAKLFRPMVPVPDFIQDNNKPNNIISALYCTKRLQPTASRYKRFIISDDGSRVYVLYENLYKDEGTACIIDTMFINGIPAIVFVLDYEAIREGDTDTVLNLLFVITLNNVCHLQAKYASMLYRPDSVLKNTLDEAQVILYISFALSIYANNDRVRKILIDNIKNLKGFETFDERSLDAYINVISESGLELLLDNSIAGAPGTKHLEDGNETV